VEATLIEVTEFDALSPPDRQQAKRTPFSLVFRCGKETPLPQGTYTVEHERMGTLEIFLVPIGPDEGGLCYEAVFN
jgi:hypothetical protein